MSVDIAYKILFTRFNSKSASDRTEDSLKDLIYSYKSPEGISELKDDEKVDLYDKIYTQFYRDILNNKSEIIINEGITLSDPKEHIEWNPDEIKSFYWNHLSNFLSGELLRKHTYATSAKILKSLDHETGEILSNMEDPRRDEFSSKGLVVGYVQSGKTQNFTGLIAKSADAGYRLFVILAGMYNSLRQQTQVRIDKELTGYNTLNLDENFVEWFDNSKSWVPLTSAGSKIDGNSGEFGLYHKSFNDIFKSSGPPVIAVVKKNSTVLKKLLAWISDGKSDVLDSVPLLMIDDEADQASIDTTRDNEAETTAINRAIRGILEKFRRSSYIGYTATPFANVLIGRDKVHPELDSDLYPRNFIHTLPEPENYFGTYLLFAEDFSDSFLESVPDSDKHEITVKSELTESLDKSIITFLISIVIRIFRGDSDKPMSMLIHVDHLKSGHEKCLDITEQRIKSLTTILTTNTFRKKSLIRRINEIYDDFIIESKNILNNLNLKNELPDFDYVLKKIPDVLNEIKIYKLNSDSDDELNYIQSPDLKVIAIGGNQLSRGLTLEGLMTTYFLRNSKQYDTLLQMGRWFGYRPRFEDLIRIFTPDIIKDSFAHLAAVERELRDNFSMYTKEPRVTPAEIAPIIRDHVRLNVTSRNKMGAGVKIRYYGKTTEQTIWFPLNDVNKLQQNFDLAELLINRIANRKKVESKQTSFLYRDVNAGLITSFLESYQKPDSKYIGDKGIDIPDVLRYIDQHGLDFWNVCVAGSENTEMQETTFGPLKGIRPFQRSRKISRKYGAYDIGVLSSKNHLRIDLEPGATDAYNTRTHPLLVLYKIDRNSGQGNSKNREALFEGLTIPVFDPIGFAIVFPQSKIQKGEYDYIGQIFE